MNEVNPSISTLSDDQILVFLLFQKVDYLCIINIPTCKNLIHKKNKKTSKKNEIKAVVVAGFRFCRNVTKALLNV